MARTVKSVADYEIKHHEQARYFENPLLEALSKTPWWAPLAVWVPIFGVLMYGAAVDTTLGAGAIVGLALGGLVFWSLSEYWLHRKFFHWTRPERLHYIIHGAHHIYPNDNSRVVFPPTASLILGALFYGLFLLVLGYAMSLPFFAGFVVGYLWYDMTHFWTHVAKPKTRYGKFLRRHHMLHHFSEPEKKFGVSSPAWDFVFGTYGKPAGKGKIS
ncbi:MAG: fatty acid hydroxylase [Deltaproteobacteria bacterium]|nr:MAG: fatty acid hydroxylase [Deltaproteobacteria bacterium]